MNRILFCFADMLKISGWFKLEHSIQTKSVCRSQNDFNSISLRYTPIQLIIIIQFNFLQLNQSFA